MDMMEIRRRMMMKPQKGGGLPDAYQRVEWIASSGTQWINSGVIGKPSVDVTATLEYTSLGNGNFGMLGSRNGSTRFYILSVYLSCFHMGIGGDLKTTVDVVANQKYAIRAQYDGYTAQLDVDGNNIINLGNQNATTPYNMYIFACNDYGTVARQCSAKLYDMKIKIDGETVRDLVPCYRKTDDEAGLYDLAQGEFLTNSGTGSFTIPT